MSQEPAPPDSARPDTNATATKSMGTQSMGTQSMGIEAHGVDTIPEADRTAPPRSVANILVGSSLCLGVVIFGWLPATFGLDFWSSVSSMVVGTLIGTAFVAPLALVSLRTATNLSTSSGAQFGVRGRLIGSGIGLLLSLGYAALTVWTGGAAVVGPLHKMFGLPDGGKAYTITFIVLAILTVLAAIFGYTLLERFSTWLAVGMTVLMVVGVFAYAGRFSSAPVVNSYMLDGYWPTWALSCVASGISGPTAFFTLLGDYTRYISPHRHKPGKVLAWTCVGMIFGLLIPQLFGTFTAYASHASDDYVGPFVAAAPMWFLPLILVNGLFGTVGNGGILLYSMGLDLDAIVPKFTRVQATSLVALISTVLVFVGYFAWNAQDAVTAFVLLLTAVGTPWAVITLLGYFRSSGRYDPDALQVYNRRSRGGVYWYTGGWNLRATVSWAIGSTIGLLEVDTSLYKGPLLAYTDGIDLSFVLAAVSTAIVYLLLTARKEHRPPEIPQRHVAFEEQATSATSTV